MRKHEYKYPGGTEYLDPWEKPEPRVKKYDRQKLKMDTEDIIDDLYDIGWDSSHEEYIYINFWEFPNE